MNPHAGALVLFSGGQDSTTCLAWALDRFERVETIGFDYGQRHRIELECRTQVLRAFRERFPDWGKKLGDDRVLDLAVLGEVSSSALTTQRAIEFDASGLPNTFVPGRNLLFFTLAGALAYRRELSVLVGGMCETDYSGYPDCRDDTLKAQQVTLSLGLDTRVVIETPLMWLDKAATWALAARLGGDALVELIRRETHSCYLGDRSKLHPWGFGCGSCPACALREGGWNRYQRTESGSKARLSPRLSGGIQRFALADAIAEPWKNGQGMTRTLASGLNSAGRTDREPALQSDGPEHVWDWRISVADLEGCSAFSTFEQVDRTLVLLNGGPLTLHRAQGPIALKEPGAWLSFGGEEILDATIDSASAQAFNLMTRRSKVRSTMRVIKGESNRDPAENHHTFGSPANQRGAATNVAFVVAGSYRVESPEIGALTLHAGQGVILGNAVAIHLETEVKGDSDPSPTGSSALGSEPWLILITLESGLGSGATSGVDSGVLIAP